MTLEDEAAICNVIVWPHVFRRYRPIVMGARLILVKGKLQREGLVTHVVAERLEDLSPLLATLTPRDEPMPLEPARADHVKRPDRPDARDAENRRRPRLLYPSRDFH
jgi:error-prone DNA polymerase